MAYLGPDGITVGYYKEHPSWKVPVDPRFIPYHIGVFSVTGGGKSFLARYELIPLLRRAGYDVLIFDWKGCMHASTPRKKNNSPQVLLKTRLRHRHARDRSSKHLKTLRPAVSSP